MNTEHRVTQFTNYTVDRLDAHLNNNNNNNVLNYKLIIIISVGIR